MPKMRIHEVAKQLNKTSKEIIAALKQNGIEVQSHMSTIDDEGIAIVKKAMGPAREPEKKSAPAREAVTEKKPAPVNTESSPTGGLRGTARENRRPEGEGRPVRRVDSEGRPVRRVDSEGRPIRRVDSEGRPVRRVDSEGRPVRRVDSEGRPVRRVDSEGRPIRRVDSEGRPIRRVDSEGRPVRRVDSEGRPVRRTDGEGRPSRNPDGSNRSNRENRPDGGRGFNRDKQERAGRDNRNGEGGNRQNRDNRGGEGGNRGFNRDNRNGDGNRAHASRDRARKPMMDGDNSIATKDSRTDKGNRHDINREFNRENSNRENSRNNDGSSRGGRGNRKNAPKDNELRNNNKDRKSKTGKKPAPVAPPKKEEPKEEVIRNITLPDPVSLKELAEACKVAPAVIIKKLFLGGKMVTINTEFSFEEASELALEYNCIAEEEVKVDVIEELLKEEEEDESKMVRRPPVVCVMGHVDHGKTSLLDRIRSTHVTAGEAGGITQHIGAYVVDINGEKITFLDTPGHEAFTSMRLRGAQATDIAVLVVAADDGVMPQTIEAINHAKAAEVEVIVAVNKIDKEGANVDRVKQELTEYGLIAEDWGGKTIFVPVSAKTGEGIDELLEMISLTAEVLELKANPKRKARGLVIEAKLDKGRGPVATILIQKGTLHVGDTISIGHTFGRVRAMIDDKGDRLKSAGPSVPVEILGLNDVPFSGEVMIAHGNEKEARAYAEEFIAYGREKMLEDTKSRLSLDDLFDQIQAGNVKELNLIVKADVQGSVEAVKQSLVKLSNEEVMIKVIHGAVGAINESDVTLASASNAIIIGFNVRPDSMAKTVAEQEKVDMRLYRVIYNAIEDIEAAMKGMLDPVYAEKIIGHLEIRQIYKASGVGTIAGCYVLDGMVTRTAQVRIVRDGIVIYEGTLASLKRFKDDVKEVKTGFECGLVFEKYNDVKEGDQIECFVMEEIPR